MQNQSLIQRFARHLAPWACALFLSAAIAHADSATSTNDSATVPAGIGCGAQLQTASPPPAGDPEDIDYVHLR
jgi:hypothetical protein